MNATDERRDGMDVTKLDAKHFDMLRLAKLRGLKVRRLGEGVYAVTSHTRRSDGIEWAVSSGVCSCPARGYCSHIAAAVDYFLTREAHPGLYDAYTKANSNDRLQLRLRIRSGEATRNDRIYLAYAVKLYEQRREAAKRASGIRRVESVTPTGKPKVKEYAGPFQI